MLSRRIASILVLLVLWLLAFTTSAQDSPGPSTDLPGQIVYIGQDFNVYNFEFTNFETHQLTDDASSRRHYQWPTWSTDGRLAYFCCDLRYADSLGSEAFISPDGQQPGELAYDGNGETIIYAAWSPATCAEGANCLDLALLVNDVLRGGMSIEMLRDTEAGQSTDSIAVGSPFYYSWSPAGDRLVLHRNSQRVDIYNRTTGELLSASSLPSGAFQAPAWSPVDDRVLFGTQGKTQSTTDLIVIDGEASQTLVSGIRGLVSFDWSPDGEYIAYRVATRERYGALFVVNADNGELVARSNLDGVLGFFWSPDSQRIAYVTLDDGSDFNLDRGEMAKPAAQQPQTRGLLWSTLDISDGFNRQHEAFQPTNEFVYLLLYFDQFARSHRIWSPDSTHIVYTERLQRAAPEPVVSILDVTRADANPLQIADGVFAIWSFR
jgi:TolB protein